jgi:predicted Ser/Thr protein kinase
MSAESPGAKRATDPEMREREIATAIARFIDRQSSGEPVDLDGFCRDHADLLPELRLELEAVRRIDEALDSSHAQPAAVGTKTPMPERLSGLRVLAELGAGGMGRVFLALDDRLNRKVAIKMLDARYWPNQRLADRFMREARAMARLSHPNIAGIYSLGAAGEPPHFVMEYIHGVSLAQAAEPLRPPQKMELFRKVVLAVEFLHQHGIVHRDLKPGNVLVGSDLEPKVLDFGLALQRNASERHLTRSGEVLGTLDYFSPEQAHAEQDLDARSDIFSLGVILYELLTGRLPFRGENQRAQIRTLYDQDPVLPRRIDPNLPGDLQSICLKALEKDPKNRYASAREMADDLQRFLAGEPILAVPAAYSRMMAGKIEQHVRELAGWTQDHLLSNLEFDSFRRMYDRLAEHEDAWIMQVRRLSFSQVTLYFGAWILVLGAVLVVLFAYRAFSGTVRVLVTATAAVAMLFIGVRCWRRGQRRIGIAYLLAFCLLLPVLMILVMRKYQWLAWATQNQWRLEFFQVTQNVYWTPVVHHSLTWATNAQVWWSIFLSLPAYVWLRRFTRSTVFSLVSAFMGALLCLVTLLRTGLLDWVGEYPGRFYLRLLPFAVMFFLLAIGIERLRHAADARYFYFFAVAFTLVGLSGVASVHEPYSNWLKSVAPWTHGRIEYLFMINAAIYFALQHLFDRFPSAELRWVAKTFRFVIPGHILTSILSLGIDASSRWHDAEENAALRHEARFFEILLPIAACAFIFGSIPKQMKNFLASGLLFLAVGIIRLQQDLFNGHAAWPIVLLFAGLLLMVAAANYPSLKTAFWRIAHRKL